MAPAWWEFLEATMKSIIDHLSLLTQLLENPLAPEAIAAQVKRGANQEVDFSSVVEVLRSHGFENVISQRELKDIPTLATPCLIFLFNEEAAVVTKIDNSGEEREYHIRQTDGIESIIPEHELDKSFLGYVWFVKRKIQKDARSELPEYHMPKQWFWKVIWRFRKYYYQVILATFIINFLALVSSFYVMNVYDRVIPNKSYPTLWALSIGVILAISFEFVAKLIRAHLVDIAGKKADLIISSALFRRVMALDLAARPASSGSYANNLRDFESVREFMTSASLLTLVDLPFAILFVSVIALVGGKLAIVPLTIIPLVTIVGLLVQPKLSFFIHASMKEGSQRQGLAVEAIEGVETLKTNNAQSWAQQKWDAYTAKTAAVSIQVKDLSNLIVNFSVMCQQMNTVFLVLLGTFLIHAQNPGDRITMGALIAAVILSGRALAPLAQIAGLATRFQQAKVALSGVNSIIDRKIERDYEQNYITLEKVAGQIAFKNMSFQYHPKMPPVINQMNLVIRPQEKVAIIGSIGSGKSTMLKLLAGLYQTAYGNVTLDNVDVRQIDPNHLRDRVVLMEQSPRLFLGTLRENLDIARRAGFTNDKDLINVLHSFGLDYLVQHNQRGLDMPLGENGMGLSGGQKQMIALCRLLLRTPQVVLMDEPTTGLDQVHEARVLQIIAQWARHRTMVIVTHRPQVLQIVDRVIVVEHGQIVMDGPRNAVIQRLSAPPQEQRPQGNIENKAG